MSFKEISIVSLCFVISNCSSFGGNHTEKDIRRYEKSPQYSKAEKRFVNENQGIIDQMKAKIYSLDTLLGKTFEGEDKVPIKPLPTQKIQDRFFELASPDNQIIWLGHSSFLVKMNKKVILIDPVFAYAGPYSFLGKRFQKPVISLKSIPKVDLVLISHDHFDHLEMSTVKYLSSKDTRFIVPLGVGRHLKYWGVESEKIFEKDWWESVRLFGLNITITPARHYSGRYGLLANDTLWASFTIRSNNHNLYFSGDSGYGEHFSAIAKKLGPFSIAFMENGQYHKISREIHLFPEDAHKAYKDIQAKYLFPMHWGVFALSDHSWYEPILEISELAALSQTQLLTPKIGQVVDLNKPASSENWWTELIPKNSVETTH